MDRLEIIKEYIKFCKDTKKAINKEASRNAFVNNYITYQVKMHGLKDIENIQKELINILKYNTLTICHLYIINN